LNQAIVSRYIKNHLGITLFLLILVFLINYWVGSNLKKIKSEKEFSAIILGRVNYVPKYPFFSSLMVILAIAPFFYPNPPVSFFSLVLVVLVSISGILLRKRIGKDLYQVWWLMFFLFLISTASNLYWEIAYQERWHLLLFSFFGIFLALRLLKLQKANEEFDIPPYIKIFARVYIAFCSFSILANVLGRFSPDCSFLRGDICRKLSGQYYCLCCFHQGSTKYWLGQQKIGLLDFIDQIGSVDYWVFICSCRIRDSYR
jgi:potassium efflux system protein